MTSSDGVPIRVLMICPQFRPIVGGYERAAERLATALAAVGIEVVIIAERRQRAWPAIELVDGYEVRRLRCWYRRRFHTISSILSFACFLLCEGRRFGVWHVHQYGVHAALAVAFGKLAGRPVVLKLTSSATMGVEQALGGGSVGRMLRFLHRRVSACVATSEEMRVEAIRFGIPAQRTHLIPNGVDGRQFRPGPPQERAAARRVLGLDCAQLVLCVGRLSVEKNIAGLLDAWAAIETRARAGVLLAIVGDGPDRDQIHARAQMPDVAGTVHLAGPRSDVATWYRAADVYVISSHNEGLSNSMIEALASGVPVISTRVSGSSILAESPAAGLLVNVGDGAMLARALERLLEDASMRTQLGENARRAFESRFSLETISKKTIWLYQNLLDRHEKPGKS